MADPGLQQVVRGGDRWGDGGGSGGDRCQGTDSPDLALIVSDSSGDLILRLNYLIEQSNLQAWLIKVGPTFQRALDEAAAEHEARELLEVEEEAADDVEDVD